MAKQFGPQDKQNPKRNGQNSYNDAINGIPKDETGAPEIATDETTITDETATDETATTDGDTENSTQDTPTNDELELMKKVQSLITESIPPQEKGKNISVYLTNEAFTLLQNYCKKHKIKNRSTVIDTIIKSVLQ